MAGASSPVTDMVPSGSTRTAAPASWSAWRKASAWGERTRTWALELCATNWAMGRSAMRCPRPMTTTWSAVSAISLMRWLDTNTARPSAASPRSSVRTHRMPSGSSPFTGSSKSSTPGSPSMAAAMPRRWVIPSENFPARLRATAVSPTRSSTSSTRRGGRALVWASANRWLRALRPGCTALDSSRPPTSRSGHGRSW